MSYCCAASVVELGQRVDELATRLALAGVTSGLVADLVNLAEEARDAGVSIEIASELAELKNGQTPDKKFEDLVSQEIGRFQQMLEDQAASEETTPEATASMPLSLSEDPEMVGEFVVETRDHLTSIESHMLVLDQNATDMAAIHAVFRAFHTIKGLAGFLEFAEIQETAHEVETLLDLARNSKLAITPAVVDVVLEGADYLKQATDGVEAALAGTIPPAIDHRPLLSRIRGAITGGPEGTGTAPTSKASEAAKVEVQSAPASVEQTLTAQTVELAPTSAQLAPTALEVQPATTSVQPASAPIQDGTAKESRTSKAQDYSVRVDTSKLDHLMEMVGEMVIAQSLIRHNQSLSSFQDSRLQRDLSQLARITIEVQRTTMGMRMVPVGQLFQRTARLVRDISRKVGKQVELETSGEDTELDKTIAEELADPLMHMVRNSLDHGIETPDARIKAGKNPTARIRLAAYHQGGQIVIEISDDGRGLDCEKIINKAKQNGLIQDGAQLSENEIFHLIFEPGFSTAEKITDISGRGVGMDVVRGHVQKLRGRIDIQSKAGQGTTFYLKLPLTLAIIEGLVVVVGDHRYIAPIFAVKEMFRPTAEMLSTIRGREEMAMVRGQLLPLVRLHRRFGIKPRSENPTEGLLVVAECQEQQFCLFVDDLLGKQEVVIKSLGEVTKNVSGIAGGAILGDGRVGLILDMEGVFRGRHMSSVATVFDVRDLTSTEFDQIRKLAYDKFGLTLRDGKEALVSARLRKLIGQLKFRSFHEYYRHVVDDRSGEAMTALIDALTTNHTSFFREPAHFEFLRQTILPRLRERDRIAIWSAASSTGEEPYSIAFCLLEELGEKAFAKTRILATDISTRVLAKAQQATYPAEHFAGIPADRLRRYLLRGNGSSSGLYRVKPEVQAAVEFRQLNLMESFAQLGPFPVIFCRNVMIYFDKPTQENLVNRMASCLEPGGYLLIGHSESLNGCKHPFRYVRPAVYRKPESGER